MTKTYRLSRGALGAHVHIVEGANLTPLPMHDLDVTRAGFRARRSPSGFEWGYHGSGPAETARQLLWDHLGEEPHPAAYQAFKRAWVGALPHEGGEITSDELEEWIRGWRATNPGLFLTVAAYQAYGDEWVQSKLGVVK